MIFRFNCLILLIVSLFFLNGCSRETLHRMGVDFDKTKTQNDSQMQLPPDLRAEEINKKNNSVSAARK